MIMANIDLAKYGISGVTEIVYNPSYEVLFEEETKAGLEGFEVGQETELGAVNVMTGIYTGRSPKDKYIVMDENSKDTVWWTSDEYKNDNHPMSEEVWATLKEIAMNELSNKRLFVSSRRLRGRDTSPSFWRKQDSVIVGTTMDSCATVFGDVSCSRCTHSVVRL